MLLYDELDLVPELDLKQSNLLLKIISSTNLIILQYISWPELAQEPEANDKQPLSVDSSILWVIFHFVINLVKQYQVVYI